MSVCEEPSSGRLMANHNGGPEAEAGEDSPPRKRLKLAGDDLRRRALEHKLLRAKTTRDKANELLCELFYLQAGGDMTDYASWRKRPPAPALRAFLERRRLQPLDPPPPIAAAPPASPQEEIAERAKREAHVARRVAALARAGLWAERRLPRVLEPPRAKTHRDYLLEEMTWLSQDFAHERKWKKQAARRVARAAQRYLQEKAAAAGREERAKEIALRRVAATCARDVRAFWDDAEKLARWRRGRRVDALRKRALDERLDYIVDRTEHYSRKLAAGLRAPASDDEFAPSSGSSDDEETIAAADGEAGDTREELEALRAEGELGLDAVLASLPAGYLRHTSPPPTASPSPASPASPAAESELRALAEEALALQPAGITLAEAQVATPAPRLLRHALREYQHVGLHWLATMHERKLNGILADEMGLGKTIQSIALLAHLALEHADWGPHLVVAPTSVVLNWEMEFKKWCPAFKILTYYGTIKERKAKRVGWTKPNSFHVCITSYKLVVQDHQSFRRKRWKYLILDEAQNIKNFKSQRWQTLLNFSTERRLLLTGTPLQNSLLELWSLMHFLMPAVFASHSEFREWFAPVAAADDSGSERLVRRLHALLRPFLLRRLKADVERQMPSKYEHVVLCRLSKRQRCLYDDFMGRARTRDALSSGRLLGVIDVLMQLRKVCNHPELFEARGVQSPLRLPALEVRAPAVCMLAGPRERISIAAALGRDLASLEASGAHAVACARARHLAPPRRLVEELPAPVPPPPAPRAELRLHVRLAPRPAPRPAPARSAPRPVRPAPPPTVPPAPVPRPAGSPHEEATHRAKERIAARRTERLRRLALVNERRSWRLPLLGVDLREAVRVCPPPAPALLLRDRMEEARDADERYSMCVGGACAPCPELQAGAGAAWRPPSTPAPAPPVARLLVPHPRLLQYDCGKLQALDRLLRRLRAAGHRVLIFTQMTRVLDVLESFLCMHGHTYLRLDGATRVDRRQTLVDRFNNDRRLFAMILSTRSGGVGLNLAGADTVVFYDSDWNPTMDAQAQDRAHRIGQTRDVHVYRLVSAGTVEENILRKAEQKRALGHRAIDAGRFTADNIRALLGADRAPADPAADEPADLERALTAAEDEADAAAAVAAAGERHEDEAEFDEREPEPERDGDREDPELQALLEQLTPVERYAVRVVESSEAAGEAERAELADLQRQRDEWRASRVPADPEPAALTYDARDARAQVWICSNTGADMPMWCPPTPPHGPGDVYEAVWMRALYRAGPAPDAALPAPRIAPARPPARRMRPAPPPAGLFDRPPPRPRARPAPRAAVQADWTPREDAALRRALRLQRPTSAHPSNWEWCAELVAAAGPPAHRGPRACRERHEAGAAARGRRRADDERAPWPRMDALRAALARRAEPGTRRVQEPLPHNPQHAALLRGHGIELHSPPAPTEVAARRADRLARLKQAASPAPAYRATTPATATVTATKTQHQQLKILQTAGSASSPPRAVRPHVLVAHVPERPS